MTPTEKAEKKLKLDKWNDKKFDYHCHKINKRKKIVKRGEVYFVNLGENIGSEENKVRPVVVIQSNIYGAKSPVFTCAIITSTPSSMPDVHATITGTYPYTNIMDGSIEKLSGTINLTQIRTIGKERIVGNKICKLNSVDMAELNQKLQNFLAIADIIKKKDNRILFLENRVKELEEKLKNKD